MSKRQMPVCRACGSPEVMGDCYVTWDVDLQEWVAGEVYEKGGYCPDCDGEARFKWVTLPEETEEGDTPHAG